MIAELQRLLAAQPKSQAIALALGRALLEAGEADGAARVLAALTNSRGSCRKRALAAVVEAERMKALQRSPAGYVRHLFDQFAPDYDRCMVADLNYRAPAILRALAEMVMGSMTDLDVLDLGCGTGLAAAAFRDVAQRLDGVDLSPRSIERARAREIYTDLFVADLEDFLQRHGRRYDLLIAADTLVYFGDLASVFRGAFRRLRGGRFFLFTVEKQVEPGFSLGPKRRYHHSGEYLRDAAVAAGFAVMGLLDCTPRFGAGQPVDGLAVALQRP